MTEEQQRIRSYLTAQAAKLAPADIVDKVRAAMGEVRSAAFAIPAARFCERPGPDQWSANEVMAHVVSAGAHFADGIVRILDGRPSGPPAVDRIEPGAPERSAAAWWTELEADRERLFERVRRADARARLEETIPHRMFGPLNWRESLLFLRLHDLDHAGQLAQIAAALG